MLWVLFGFVAALALVVLLLLPYIVAEHNELEATLHASTGRSQPDPLMTGVMRHDAEQALQNFLRLRAQPELAQAELWAADDWQAAVDLAARGDKHFGRGRFDEAIDAYKIAGSQMQQLLDSRQQRLEDKMSRGWLSLQENKSDDAIAAFTDVLTMQAGNGEARDGLARARVRNEVLNLMAAGEHAEEAGNLQSAASSYLAALNLDPLFAPAQSASQALEKKLASLAFQDAMSHALQSLDQGSLAVAREAIDAAARIYPDTPAVKDAQQRYAAAQREAKLSALRKQAGQHADREDWQAAADLYRKALSIDAQAAFAHRGQDLAQQQLKTHAQLDHYLADITRLYSVEPLANALKLLAANDQTPAGQPALASKLTQLQEAVRLAQIPIELTIRSDNQTEVLIYHVGRLGSFTEKKLTLRPGRYTLTGTRTGFRDVRKIVHLRPGSTRASLLIRCEEPI